MIRKSNVFFSRYLAWDSRWVVGHQTSNRQLLYNPRLSRGSVWFVRSSNRAASGEERSHRNSPIIKLNAWYSKSWSQGKGIVSCKMCTLTLTSFAVLTISLKTTWRNEKASVNRAVEQRRNVLWGTYGLYETLELHLKSPVNIEGVLSYLPATLDQLSITRYAIIRLSPIQHHLLL